MSHKVYSPQVRISRFCGENSQTQNIFVTALFWRVGVMGPSHLNFVESGLWGTAFFGEWALLDVMRLIFVVVE